MTSSTERAADPEAVQAARLLLACLGVHPDDLINPGSESSGGADVRRVHPDGVPGGQCGDAKVVFVVLEPCHPAVGAASVGRTHPV